ncbi:Uncharacterised protein [Sphingobacterium spiritivorum]|uniref:DUF3828 domain-containing protein n=1 Tax=Sphingobacterium spiritivorum TaxID=258 RepID=A0A380CUC9_SPHSI|nr:hypothetical protein [Sphingobacterium spiritivorum]SUJ29197.1 Uncharacterised protein [Sphingobacterium spiritivorum]
MKLIAQTLIILLAVSMISCNGQSGKANTQTVQTDSVQSVAELESLTKELYKWVESNDAAEDFNPLPEQETDSLYSGLDKEAHKKRIAALKDTHFFAEEFLENYNRIGLTIDEKLRNNTFTWYVGELPPFGNDANPWCNCQDNPDNYWKKISLQDVVVDGNTATYNWTWGEGGQYKMKAVKENDGWKISYMQGFDFEAFFSQQNN